MQAHRFSCGLLDEQDRPCGRAALAGAAVESFCWGHWATVWLRESIPWRRAAKPLFFLVGCYSLAVILASLFNMLFFPNRVQASPWAVAENACYGMFALGIRWALVAGDRRAGWWWLAGSLGMTVIFGVEAYLTATNRVLAGPSRTSATFFLALLAIPPLIHVLLLGRRIRGRSGLSILSLPAWYAVVVVSLQFLVAVLGGGFHISVTAWVTMMLVIWLPSISAEVTPFLKRISDRFRV